MLELFLCFIAAPAIEIQYEEFPLADVAHCGVAEAGEGVLDRLSLGVEYGAFWHYPHVCFHAVSITLPVTASCSAPFAGRQKGVFETHLDDAGQLVFVQSHAGGVCILFVQRGVKHGRIIGGKHNGYALAQEFGEGMLFDSCVFALGVPGEGGGLGCEWLGGGEGGLEICCRPLLSQEHYADGQGYFRIDHTLHEQMFGEVASNKRIVLRLAQERSDPLEGCDEFGEVAVGVALTNFLLGHDDTVTGPPTPHTCPVQFAPPTSGLP